MSTLINKTFDANTKDVNYLNRDFTSLRQQLIDFTKQYYPQSYKDFSESSPGQIFIDQAAYVGDVLSYYTDQQFFESYIQFAQDRRNIINSAKYLGYKPKVSSASSSDVDVFQLLPSIRTRDNEYLPDERYCLILQPFSQLSSTPGVNFVIEESIDFSQDTKFSPREISVYSRDNTGAPQFYLIKKAAKAYSGTVITKQVSVTDQVPFYSITLDETNVLKIISVVDSNNNNYYEVDYLAQDTIPIEVDNVPLNNQTLSPYRSETPKILKYLRTEKRYVTVVNENNQTTLQFGANTENFENTIVIPNPTNVGVALSNLKNLNISLDNTNVLKEKSYGMSPSNTTLTITYVIGGGLNSNVNSGEINKILGISYLNDTTSLTDSEVILLNTIKNSLRVNNIEAATGGDDAESDEEIRQNAMLNFSTQNRMVTEDDFLLRVYALPPQLGNISKAFVQSNLTREVQYNGLISGILNTENNSTVNLAPLNPLDRKKFLQSNSPFTNNLYLLGYDANKNLTQVNPATLQNLTTYIQNYKILTDKINIIDGYIINIGVEFKITVFKGFNKSEVLNNCIQSVKSFFDIDKWSFNQPINLSQINFEIMQNEGVQSVSDILIKNLTIDEGNYSPVAYNISIATQNNIVYPSKDPSVFEVKFPDSDIKGLVV
jgi:hypothetical protein